MESSEFSALPGRHQALLLTLLLYDREQSQSLLSMLSATLSAELMPIAEKLVGLEKKARVTQTVSALKTLIEQSRERSLALINLEWLVVLFEGQPNYIKNFLLSALKNSASVNPKRVERLALIFDLQDELDAESMRDAQQSPAFEYAMNRYLPPLYHVEFGKYLTVRHLVFFELTTLLLLLKACGEYKFEAFAGQSETPFTIQNPELAAHFSSLRTQIQGDDYEAMPEFETAILAKNMDRPDLGVQSATFACGLFYLAAATLSLMLSEFEQLALVLPVDFARTLFGYREILQKELQADQNTFENLAQQFVLHRAVELSRRGKISDQYATCEVFHRPLA